MKIILLAILNSVLMVAGQVLWKIGIEKNGPIALETILFTLITPWIIAGGVLYILTTLLWLYIMSLGEITKVYPLMSLSYIIIFVPGYFIFHEMIGINKFLGALFICTGVYLINR